MNETTPPTGDRRAGDKWRVDKTVNLPLLAMLTSGFIAAVTFANNMAYRVTAVETNQTQARTDALQVRTDLLQQQSRLENKVDAQFSKIEGKVETQMGKIESKVEDGFRELRNDLRRTSAFASARERDPKAMP